MVKTSGIKHKFVFLLVFTGYKAFGPIWGLLIFVKVRAKQQVSSPVSFKLSIINADLEALSRFLRLRTTLGPRP